MKFTGFGLSKGDDEQNLLILTFEDEHGQKEWMPKWADVCSLAKNAVLTESINARGQWNREMESFLETANFVRKVCRYVEAASDVESLED